MIWRSVLLIAAGVIIPAGLFLFVNLYAPVSNDVVNIVLGSVGIVLFLIAPFMIARGLWNVFQLDPNRPAAANQSDVYATWFSIAGPLAAVLGAFFSIGTLIAWSSGAAATVPVAGWGLLICKLVIWVTLVFFFRFLRELEQRCERYTFARRRQLHVARLGIHGVIGSAVLVNIILGTFQTSLGISSSALARFNGQTFAMVLFWSVLVLSLSRGSSRLVEHEVRMCEALDDGAS